MTEPRQSDGEAVPGDKQLSPQAKWNTENPKAMWAHAALRSAIKKGLIQRGPCEVCGVEHGQDGAIVDGHHDPERYDEPLAVTWLCRLHHRHAHRRGTVNVD